MFKVLVRWKLKASPAETKALFWIVPLLFFFYFKRCVDEVNLNN